MYTNAYFNFRFPMKSVHFIQTCYNFNLNLTREPSRVWSDRKKSNYAYYVGYPLIGICVNL